MKVIYQFAVGWRGIGERVICNCSRVRVVSAHMELFRNFVWYLFRLITVFSMKLLVLLVRLKNVVKLFIMFDCFVLVVWFIVMVMSVGYWIVMFRLIIIVFRYRLIGCVYVVVRVNFVAMLIVVIEFVCCIFR